MRKTNIQKSKEIGETWAVSMFNDFVNHPEYRGVNFTWENFPTLASGLAECSCFMNFPYRVKNLPKLKEECRKSCKNKAKELVNYTRP